MLSILVWWAIPSVAVVIAALVAATARRVRRAREDIGTLHRYQRARQVLARTQQPAPPERPTVATLDRPHG